VGGTLVSGTTQQCKKYCTIHNTDTVAYATHSGSYSTEHKKEIYYTLWYTRGTQQLQWYTIFTVVHNAHMTQKNLGYLEVMLLQPLILSST